MLDASSAWREIVFYWGYTSFIVTITTVPGRKTMKVEVNVFPSGSKYRQYDEALFYVHNRTVGRGCKYSFIIDSQRAEFIC